MRIKVVILAAMLALALDAPIISVAARARGDVAPIKVTATSESSIAAPVVVKSGAGKLFAVLALNGTNSTCWLQVIDSASPSLGRNVVLSIPLPASTTLPLWSPLPGPVNFRSGLSVGVATTNSGTAACGAGANLTIFYD